MNKGRDKYQDKYSLDERLMKMQSRLNTNMIRWYCLASDIEVFIKRQDNPHYVKWAENTFNTKK